MTIYCMLTNDPKSDTNFVVFFVLYQKPFRQSLKLHKCNTPTTSCYKAIRQDN